MRSNWGFGYAGGRGGIGIRRALEMQSWAKSSNVEVERSTGWLNFG